MRIKALPGDFVVQEQVQLRLQPQGPWAVYRLRKVERTTLEVQTELAAQLGLARDRVVFPALKDRTAVTIQYLTLPDGAPPHLAGQGFQADRVGARRTPLGPGDLIGNCFTVVLRDLSAPEAAALSHALAQMGIVGLPNYFDDQRMGSYAPGWGYIGKAILLRDAEAALYAYLARSFVGDPRLICAFKQQAAALWPDWRAIMDVAPRPSNYRSLLTFLIDHPAEYRPALNLIPQRLLALYLAAYQSYLWNAIVSAYLESGVEKRAEITWLEGHAQRLAIPSVGKSSPPAQLALCAISLPGHRATYAPEVAPWVDRVMQAEGLQLDDLKARLLKRAYLPKGQRPMWVVPGQLEVAPPEADGHLSGRYAVRVTFAMPRGAYATLVLKIAALIVGLEFPSL